VVLLKFQTVDVKGGKGPVESHGSIRVGDALLCIDEVPIELLSFEHVLKKLKDAERPVSLTFGRTDKDTMEQVERRIDNSSKKLRDVNEHARLLELEEQRRVRTQATNFVTADGTKRTTKQSAQQNDTESSRVARTVYTANDFKTDPFKTFNRVVLIIFVILSLAMIGYMLREVKLFAYFKQAGVAETFTVSKADVLTNKKTPSP